MEFRLIYKGTLSGNARKAPQKHELRNVFHPQLKELWNHEPFSGIKRYLLPKSDENLFSILKERGGVTYAPLISEVMGLRAELNILLFRPIAPGSLISNEADLDNQIKTLIDGLRIPDKRQKIDTNEYRFYKESPFFCLLEDDSLVTGFSVETDRLLNLEKDVDAMAIIKVNIKSINPTMNNLAIITGSMK